MLCLLPDEINTATISHRINIFCCYPLIFPFMHISDFRWRKAKTESDIYCQQWGHDGLKKGHDGHHLRVHDLLPRGRSWWQPSWILHLQLLQYFYSCILLISDEEKQKPILLTSIASSEVMMALKRAMMDTMTLFSFFFFFHVGGVGGSLHGSFTSNSPLRELARGAFLASWPVTNVPVGIN